MDNFRPVICVTRDEHGAPAATIACIYSSLFKNRLSTMYIQNGGLGYAHARNVVFADALDKIQRIKVRGSLLDDDVKLTDQPQLDKIIKYADEKNYNVVAPYRTLGNRLSIVKRIPPKPNGTSTEMLTEEEARQIKPFERIQLAGLGFYYGWIPLDYKFHEGIPYIGEDLNFFEENPQLEPRLAPLYVEHLKTASLPGIKY
jgi:hypothetical protein